MGYAAPPILRARSISDPEDGLQALMFRSQLESIGRQGGDLRRRQSLDLR
jgi:hypothetical protein